MGADSIERLYTGKDLIDIFCKSGGGGIDVVEDMVEKRYVDMFVQEELLETTYFSTGLYRHSKLGLAHVPSAECIGHAGCVRSILKCGIRILQKAGPRNKSGADYAVAVRADKDAGITSIFVFFLFIGLPVRLSIEEAYGHRCITVYISD